MQAKARAGPVGAVIGIAVVLAFLSACSIGDTAVQSGIPRDIAVTCPRATKKVSDAAALSKALAEVQPGATIALADGVYEGNFKINRPGSRTRPIHLCGGPGAILSGGAIDAGYAVHVEGVSWWRLVGFSVRNAKKGVMLDQVQHAVLQGLNVSRIGEEGIHLRAGSSDNIVRSSVISLTGLAVAEFGEGIYVGSAQSNWCRYTLCQPDRSDRNLIIGNVVTNTRAEAVDIKEGTTGGALVRNIFDGNALTHADSWVDVKGSGWTIAENKGTNSSGHGFQTHEVLVGWGTENVFRANVAAVNGPGFGYEFVPPLKNTLACDNKSSGAAEGHSNVTCQ